jgi:hypothetical protein
LQRAPLSTGARSGLNGTLRALPLPSLRVDTPRALREGKPIAKEIARQHDGKVDRIVGRVRHRP